jgi:coenzyme PQQ synthesis protein D (PqqD)
MLRISDTIRQTQTVDGGVLLDVHHGQMFCLNIVGAKILELMQKGYDETRIADEISRDYGASAEVVHADVIEFIEALHKNHILQPARPGGVL